MLPMRKGESMPPEAGKSPALSRRTFLRAAAAGATCLAAAGCDALGPPRPTTAVVAPRRTPVGGKVQLVYQDWRTDWFPPMAQRMLEKFHETHPNIRVFYVPDPDNLEDRMLAEMRAGTAPDVFQGCCAHFPTWAQQGQTLDLRKYVEADLDQATIGDWDPAQYRAFYTRDGRLFGLPKYHGALAIYYNKDLFAHAGVALPDDSWDMDAYLSAMSRLVDDPDSDGRTDTYGSMFDVSWERIQVHVNSWGGHLVDPDNPQQSRMAEAPALQAMEWLRARIWDDRVMASPLDVRRMTPREAFIAQRVAMVEEGSWALKDILSQARFRVGIAPFPSGPARRVTLATTDGFGIYAGTRHPEAAWELMKFLVSPEYGRAMSEAQFLQPARASLVDEWVENVRQQFPAKAADADIAAFAHGHRHRYSVTPEIFSNMAEAKPIVQSVWERIYTFGEAKTDEIVQASQAIEALQQKGAHADVGQDSLG